MKRAGAFIAAAILAAHIYVLVLGNIPAPRTWTMTGRVMAGETLQRQNIKLEEISPYLIAAVIAAEDARFCSHNGIDFEAVEKAIEHNKKGGKRRGGSTITQQTAKNLFFWNGGGLARKAGEAYAAVLIDTLWSKPRIMEHYLNIAEWGDGIFGAQAASQARFGKPASELTAYEAALLASVLPSPNKWRVDPPSEFVSGRAHTINARLKVTAREGFGDCVLSNHPAYKRSDFGLASPKPKRAADEDNKTPPKISNESKIIVAAEDLSEPAARLKENSAPEDPSSSEESLDTPSEKPAPPSLDDILSSAQKAAKDARETDAAMPNTTPDNTHQSSPGAPQSSRFSPKDIRPLDLKTPPEDLPEVAAEAPPKPNADVESGE